MNEIKPQAGSQGGKTSSRTGSNNQSRSNQALRMPAKFRCQKAWFWNASIPGSSRMSSLLEGVLGLKLYLHSKLELYLLGQVQWVLVEIMGKLKQLNPCQQLSASFGLTNRDKAAEVSQSQSQTQISSETRACKEFSLQSCCFSSCLCAGANSAPIHQWASFSLCGRGLLVRPSSCLCVSTSAHPPAGIFQPL